MISADSLNLNGKTLVTSNSSSLSAGCLYNGTVDCRGSSIVFSGTTVNVAVLISGVFGFSNTTFYQTVRADNNGATVCNSAGLNTFKGELFLSNSGGGSIIMAKLYRDIYEKPVSVFDTLGGTISLAVTDTSFFHDDVTIECKGSGINLGNTSGYASLTSGKKLLIGSKGFTSGTLLLYHLLQNSADGQTLTLTGSSILNINASKFGGDITFSAPSLLCKNSTFSGKSYFTKTGTASNSWEGGNSFAGRYRFTNTASSSGQVTMQTNAGDTYADSVTINSGALRYFASTSGESVYNNSLYFTGNLVDFSQGSGSIKFAGSGNNLIKGSDPLFITNLVIAKSSGTLALQTPVKITSTLTLNQGILVSDTTNLLTFASGSSWSNASNHSFVSGPVLKYGNSAFTFPIGAGYSMSIARISAPSNSTDAFMAQYFEDVCPVGDSLDANLESISSCGYWDIKRPAGSSNVKITLGWDTLPCMNFMEDSIKIALWKNSKWNPVNIDTCTTNSNDYGRIISSNSMSDFGKYVIANVAAVNVTVNFLTAQPGRTLNDYFGLNVWDVIESADVFLDDPDCQGDIIDQSPATLRFPTAIEANWWDWRTGTFIKDRKIGNIDYFLPEQFHDRQLAANLTGTPIDNSIDIFFPNVYNTGSTPMFSLNDLSSDVLYQSALLYFSKQNNVPTRLMELGGEVYKEADYNDVTFPTGADYANQSIAWGRKIKELCKLIPLPANNIPNFQFGICAANFDPINTTTRTATWNSTMFNTINAYNIANPNEAFLPDAVIYHDYVGTGLFEDPPQFCDKKSGWSTPLNPHRLVSPYDGSLDANGLGKNCYNDMELIFSNVFRSFAGEAGVATYLGSKNEELDPLSSNPERIPIEYPEIWVSEYGINGKASIFDGSWAHGLSVALKAMLYLESRVTKVSFFKLIGNAIFSTVFGSTDGFNFTNVPSAELIGAVPTVAHEKTAMGQTLGMLAIAMRNADEATQLSFTGQKLPRFDYYKRYNSSVLEPQLYGWYFEGDGGTEEQIILINVSNNNIALQVPGPMGPPGALSNMHAYEQIYCDPAVFINGHPTTNFNVVGPDLTIVPPALITGTTPILLRKYSIMRLFKKPCSIVLKPLTNPVCESVTEFAGLTAIGKENSNWTYTWSSSSPTEVPLTSSNGVLTPTGSTNTFQVLTVSASSVVFTVQVTDPIDACTASATCTVDIIASPGLTVSTTPALPAMSCGGTQIEITADLPNSFTGWESYIVVNSLGEGVESAINPSMAPIKFYIYPEASTELTLYAYDGQCAVSAEIGSVSIPEIDLGDDKYVCDDEMYNFTEEQIPDFSGFPGNPTITYDWNDGTSTVATEPTPGFNITATTTYTVTVTISGSTTCTLTASVTLYPVSCCSSATAPILNKDVSIQDAYFSDILDGHLTDLNTSTIKVNDGGSPLDIVINGRLTITGQNLLFFNCNLIMGEAAEIFVDPHFVLRLSKTVINPCSLMWKGIHLKESGKLAVSKTTSNRSEINGAEYGVYVNEWSSVELQTTNMKRNYISVYVPPVDVIPSNYVTLEISDTKFSCPSPLTGYTYQTVSIGTNSFAGIYINDNIATIGVAGADPVEFTDLNNGIIGINSSLIVQNTTFTSVNQHDNTYTMPLTAINGTGAFVGADIGKFASLTQTGLGTATNFDDGYIGIHAHNASLSASNNTMRNMDFVGIVSIGSSGLSTTLADNDIEAVEVGIFIGNSIAATQMIVANNEVNTSGSASQQNLAGIISVDVNPASSPANVNYDVTCNTVIGDFQIGFYIIGNPRGSFENNHTFMNSSNMSLGFGFDNCLGVKVDNNLATDGDLSIGAGYAFNLSATPLVSNNTSADSYYGFVFQGANYNTRFITNNIRLHDIGLYLDGSAVIGQQHDVVGATIFVFSNSWLDDPGGSVYATKGAVCINNSPQNFHDNQFLFDDAFITPQGNIKYPHYSIPGNGPWFKDVPQPDSMRFAIIDDCPLPIPFALPNSGTVLDRLIAKDSIQTSSFDPEASQILAADLFDNLDNNEELRNSEEYLTDFYEANENETLGKQSKVRTSMKQIYGDINNNKEDIAINDSIIKSLLIKKSENDSALFEGGLSATDSIELINQNISLIQQVKGLISETNRMLNQNAESLVIKVAFSKDLNDNISPSTTIETNEQHFNDVFLRNMALGNYALSETDLETLQDIAIQCPFAGGKAVYKARAYLTILGYFTIYDDETVCSEDENFRKAKKQHEAGLNVVVYPNPLKDECKFIYRLPKDEGADLHIYDSYGKEIYHNSLTANSVSYTVNLGSFANGVYTYSVNSQNGLIGNGKLILIK